MSLTSYGNLSSNVLSSTVTSPASVTNTDSIIVNSNLNRKFLQIQNTGQKAVLLKFGSVASTTNYDVILAGGVGVRSGDGGSLDLLGEYFKGEIHAICEDISGSSLAILEL